MIGRTLQLFGAGQGRGPAARKLLMSFFTRPTVHKGDASRMAEWDPVKLGVLPANPPGTQGDSGSIATVNLYSSGASRFRQLAPHEDVVCWKEVSYRMVGAQAVLVYLLLGRPLHLTSRWRSVATQQDKYLLSSRMGTRSEGTATRPEKAAATRPRPQRSNDYSG